MKNMITHGSIVSGNHTMFSEESGELSLAILVQSLPSNHGGDYEQTRRHWQQAKLRAAEAKHQSDDFELPPPKKHHRHISKYYFCKNRDVTVFTSLTIAMYFEF